MPVTIAYHHGIASLRGLRSDNEDSTGVFDTHDGLIAVVADGLGGHRGGAVASRMAVDEFVARYQALAPEPDAARRAFAEVNRAIHARGNREPALAGMGTTCTALILHEAHAELVHVGDTRASRLRAGRLERMTRDHNLAEYGWPNVLERAVGTDAAVRIDHAIHASRSGDLWLLCSDGVHGVLSDSDLAALLSADAGMQTIAERIVRAALDAGSTDNVTAVVCRVTAQDA